MIFFKKINFIILICFLSLFLITTALALGTWNTGFRVNKNNEKTIVYIKQSDGAPYTDCNRVTNNTTNKDYFIPTRTEREWKYFKDAAGPGGRLDANFTFENCCIFNTTFNCVIVE